MKNDDDCDDYNDKDNNDNYDDNDDKDINDNYINNNDDDEAIFFRYFCKQTFRFKSLKTKSVYPIVSRLFVFKNFLLCFKDGSCCLMAQFALLYLQLI